MHPFQTEAFDPGAPDLIQRVQAGQRLTDLYLGATAYLVAGERWVIVSGWDYSPTGPTWLAYPLPESYGVEVIPAVQAFERALGREAAALRKMEPEPTPPAAEPLSAPVVVKARKLPKGRPVALAGAVPLPGFEDVVFGHQLG